MNATPGKCTKRIKQGRYQLEMGCTAATAVALAAAYEKRTDNAAEIAQNTLF